MLGSIKVRVNGARCGAESIVLAAITSIAGFLFGYDIGQISGILLFSSFVSRFAQLQPDGTHQWQPIMQSLIVSFMSIGALLGAFTSGYTAEWWGRRKSMCFGVGMYIIGTVIQMTAMKTWVHYVAGRFVSGLGIGSLSVVVPMFQSECSPKEIRGAVIASYQLAITVGILTANAVNLGMRRSESSDSSWRCVVALGACCSIPLALGVLCLPESPRWLASREKWAGVRISVARLRGMKNDPGNHAVTEDIREIRAVLEKEASHGKGGWLECFTGSPGNIPKLRYRTLLGMAIHFLQQWTGVNYFFYYGSTIFNAAGLHDPLITQVILGSVNMSITLCGFYIVERFGRRIPLFLGALWQSVWLLVFACVGAAKDPNTHPNSGRIMIIAASFLTPLANAGISYNFGFVFVATNLTAATIVWCFLYESATLSLENVDAMYSDPDVRAWTSAKWAPPGYLNRKQRNGGVLELQQFEASDLRRASTAPTSHSFSAGDHVEKSMSGSVMSSVVTRERTYEHIEDNAS
ncbi:hexose transporter hxt5 [Gnomoniopsis smithogilvyi]|uniref:Hexose transporter hxt5 n=1 Tax=Gnomoniopsis smithogilvyi TaxID=1191159 RepID=A0A9W8YL34_9PEZI|nr:hexose transporter hxt5 [Gnomoniopsis smithogilvyi]